MRKGASEAGMFQSAHNFGLACDFVAVIDHQTAHDLGDMTGEKVLAGWSWHADNDWRFLRTRAEAFRCASDMVFCKSSFFVWLVF